MNISVVVPVYNNFDYLEQCIESLLAQTKPFFQIILIDDCSPDPRIKQVLEGYNSVANIEVHFLEGNVGICGAQDYGVEEAKGEFIAFVDCDDYLEPNAHERVLVSVENNEIDYVFTNRNHVDESGLFLDEYNPTDLIKSYGDYENCIIEHMFASHLKVIRKSKILEVGGHPRGSEGVQDWVLALAIVSNQNTLHINEALYNHRIHSKQTTSVARIKNQITVSEFRREKLKEQFSFSSSSFSQNIINRLVKILKVSSFNRLCGTALVIFENEMKLLNIYSLVLNKKELDKVKVIIIISKTWVNAGILHNEVLSRGIYWAIYVDSRVSNSISMARWYNSFMSGVIVADELADVGLQGYLVSDIELHRLYN